MHARLLAAAALAMLVATPVRAADDTRATWRQAQAPRRIYGNTWYVGSRGLSAILITSPQGHVLIDGTLPENAAMIEANIRTLGFRVRDVRVILNTHAHRDHAGAIAEIARASGATVEARAAQARALRVGGKDPADPQYAYQGWFPPIARIKVIGDHTVVRVGPMAIQALPTPGHTPGSTSWTWTSCEGKRCLHLVYVDSLNLLTAGSYRYTDPAHPERLADYRRSLAELATLPCDILLTPHPDISDFWARMEARTGGRRDALRDPAACRDYVRLAEQGMQRRIDAERKPHG